jgi:hypothetical protein
MTTAIFKVANPPEGYHQQKEDVKTELIVLENCKTLTQTDIKNLLCPDINPGNLRW